MTLRRWTALPILAALALVLMGAGPSVGDRIAAGQRPSPPVTPVQPVPCQDDSAVLVATGAAEGVLFRCVGGVPVPREGPWSTPGCAFDYQPEATFLAGTVDGWQPDTACLITTPAELAAPPTAPSRQRSGL